MVLTTRSARARASARAALPSAHSSPRSWGAQLWQVASRAARRSLLRPAMAIELQPSSTRAATTALALPPQPSTTARRPCQFCSVLRRGAKKPSTSVFSPSQPPCWCRTKVFTAPTRCARGERLRQRPATACLWGRVTLRPRQSMASSPCTTAASWSALVGMARYTQLSPSSTRAALCIAGDREWRTGSPRTPARAVLPEIGWGMKVGWLAGPVREPPLAWEGPSC